MILSEKEKTAKEVKEDIVYFKDILFILNKKRAFILVFTIIAGIFGSFYANFKKPSWGGEFQIVLRDENNQVSKTLNNSGSAEILKNIAGIEVNNSNIKTEVEILTSQSILRPIYKSYVKKSAKALKKPYVSYKKWLRSLDVKLKKGTNVLDISYVSKDKDSVLPILNKISQTYQDYSGESRKNSLFKASLYLDEQIKLMTFNSRASMDKLQKFSIKNNIGSFDGLPNPNNLEPRLSGPLNKFEMDLTRGYSSYDLLQDSSFNSGIDTKSIKGNRYRAQFLKLEELETNLRELSAFYKPESQRIKSLKLRIKELKKNITRPKDILIEYRELYRSAMRDEKLLSNLEDELSTLNLLKAKQKDPWKLISTPSLIDEPVAPKKVTIYVLSIFLGLLLSSLFFIFKNFKNDYILSDFRLNDLFEFPLLKTFQKNMNLSWGDDIKLIKKNLLHDINDSSLGIIPLCNLDSSNYSYFYEILKKNIDNKKIKISKNLIELENCEKTLLIISQNESKYNEVNSLLESLKLSKVKIVGWIFLEEF